MPNGPGTPFSGINLASIYKAQVEKNLPGVKVQIQQLDRANLAATIAKGDFQSYDQSWSHEPTAVAMMNTSFYSTGGRNFTGYKSSAMDNLLDGALKELDAQRRAALLLQAQQQANTDWPV